MKFMEKIKSKKLSKVILGSIIAAGIAVPQIAGAAPVYVYTKNDDAGYLEYNDSTTRKTVQGKRATTEDNPILVTDTVSSTVSNYFTLNVDNSKSVIGLYRVDASQNSAYLEINTTQELYSVMGVVSDENDADNSNIKFKNGTATYIYGGYYNGIDKKDANNNTVTISNVTAKNSVYGGYTEKGTAQGNIVNLQGEFSKGYYYGGYSKSDGNVVNNTITIENGSSLTNGQGYYGGLAKNGDAIDNKLIVKGATGNRTDRGFEGLAYATLIGGESNSAQGSANNNSVTIEKGKFIGSIYGGEASTSNLKQGGTVNDNKVYLGKTDDTNESLIVASGIYGGYAGYHSASRNKVTINSGTFLSGLIAGADLGGVYDTDIAKENEVIIDGGIFIGDNPNSLIFGARNKANKPVAKAEGNKVTINGGTFGTVGSKFVGIYGWDGNATTASGNEVKITSAKGNVGITGTITGASVLNGSEVTNNIVTVEAPTTGTIIINGGITGAEGFASDVQVTGNTVNIKGGTIEGTGDGLTVIGGSAGNADKGIVKNNTVDITGGKITGDVYGGYVDSTSTVEVSNNTVKISNAPDLSGARVYGSSKAVSAGSKDNNKLEVGALTTNTAVKSINNFNVIDFGGLTLGATTETDGYINLLDSSNLNNATITASSISGNGYLLTGNFSAKDVTFAGALAGGGSGVEVIDITSGYVKVGTSAGSTTEVKDKTSSTPVANYIKVSPTGATTYNLMAGKYINAAGTASGSGTLNLASAPGPTITTVAGVYSKGKNDAKNGKLIIDGATITNAVVYGNYSENGNATGDGEHANVDIKNGATVKKDVFGGKADAGAANNNVVNVNGTNTKLDNASIFGGSGQTAEGNKVTVSGGASVSNVWGASGKGANGNIVTIGTNGDTTTYVGGDVYGASGVGVSGNTVNMAGGLITNGIRGGWDQSADLGVYASAENNTINITGGKVSESYNSGNEVAGGYSAVKALNNKVNISGGAVNVDVYGNRGGDTASSDGTIKNVNITGGTLNGNVYGGYSYSGEANSNVVSISGGTVGGPLYKIYGGYSYNGKANENIVEISGGTVLGTVFAAGGNTTKSPETKDNKIILSNGINFNKDITLKDASLVGCSNGVGPDNTNNNNLEIGDLPTGTVIERISNFNNINFGNVDLKNTAESDGYIKLLNAANLNYATITANSIAVDSATGEGYLITGFFSAKDVKFGGALASGKGEIVTNVAGVGVKVGTGGGITVEVKKNDTDIPSQGNYIKVKSGGQNTVWSIMAGKYTNADGETKGDGVLTLSGTPDAGITYAGAYAKKGKASGGTVKLTGDFNGTVYGGFSADGSDTENNTLEIDGSKHVTVTSVKQVDSINVTGKVAKNAEAVLTVADKANFEETDITIAGLELEGAVKDDSYKVIANADAKINAAKVAIQNLAKVENNVVKANIINKDVTNGLTLTYSGKVVAGSYTDEAGTVTANGGVLKVSDIGTPEAGVIYTGAYSAIGSANGTVELDKSFEGALYGGYQAADKKGSGTLNVRGKDLTVKEIANFNTINFFVPATLAKGETMLKVDSDVNIAEAKVNAGINNKSALDVGDEITLLEAVSLDATGIVAGKVTENDFVDYDMNIEATEKELKAKITSKGISNENSKSPVETIAGALVMLNMGADQLAGKGLESAAAAVAAEGAASNTMTTFASVGGNKVKAKTGSHVDIKGWNFNMGLAKEIDNKAGKLLLAPVAEYGRGSYDSYIEGAGKTVHADGSSKYWGAGVMARQTNDSGFYYEGSLVGGKSTNDYSTKDIGTGISYDTSAMYIAAHLGAGKIVELGDKDKLNYYGKFFYSRLGSDDTTLSNGAKYSFDASESKRMRLGGRWTREVNTMSSLYAGMAWQYEFDAESRATVNGKTAQAPTMKGHTGIFELGWNVKPDNAKFDVDLSFLGYTGKQKGGSLNVNMNWKF